MANQTVNGVPVAACHGLIEAVKDKPEIGKTLWRAVTTWKGGFDCHSEIRQHTLSMNEPEDLGGTDTAPNMVETVLAAYGSCLTVGYALNAALRGITINDLKVEVEGDLEDGGPRLELEFTAVDGDVGHELSVRRVMARVRE